MNRHSLIDKILSLIFFDEGGGGGGGGGVGDVSEIPHGQSGDVKIMGQVDDKDDGTPDDDEEEEIPEDEGQGDDEEPDEETFETVEEDEEEGDDEGEKDEKDDQGDGRDDTEIFQGRPTLTDIKTKYPKIFKEFPELRDVIFREQEFSKNFGSVEEAEEAGTKARSFDAIEASLLGGDSSPIIEQLAKNDPEALAKVVDNFLPTVLKSSQDLYLRATIPVIEQLLHSAFNQGKSSQNANLMRSAQHIAQFIFGRPDIPDPSRRGANTGPHPAEKKLQEEREQWAQQRFQEASQDINSAIDSELEAEIMKGLDPDKKLTDRQRSKLVEDIKNEIDAALGKDESFKRQMRSLWQKATTSNYGKEQRASIKSAFLARAKALVPSVRTRLRAEWLGERRPSGDGKDASKNKKQGQKQPVKKRALPSSGASAGQGPKRPPSPRDVDYNKTSDMDLIEGRFHRKR